MQQRIEHPLSHIDGSCKRSISNIIEKVRYNKIESQNGWLLLWIQSERNNAKKTIRIETDNKINMPKQIVQF